MARVAVCSKIPLPNRCYTVLSIIIAETSDAPQEGTFLVDADYSACEVGWIYNPVINDFVNPFPQEKSEDLTNPEG